MVVVFFHSAFFFFFCLTEQAERQVEEYQSMKTFILSWVEKAEALISSNIIWSSATQLQEQIRAHQVSFSLPQLNMVNCFKYVLNLRLSHLQYFPLKLIRNYPIKSEDTALICS